MGESEVVLFVGSVIRTRDDVVDLELALMEDQVDQLVNAPTVDPIVAVPMAIVTEIRIPARITGAANGSSTSRSRCQSDSPIPSAASRTLSSVEPSLAGPRRPQSDGVLRLDHPLTKRSSRVDETALAVRRRYPTLEVGR